MSDDSSSSDLGEGLIRCLSRHRVPIMAAARGERVARLEIMWQPSAYNYRVHGSHSTDLPSDHCPGSDAASFI